MKHYTESKTMKFNAFVGTLVSVMALLQSNIALVKDLLGDNYNTILFIIIIVGAIANMFLRTKTDSAVGSKRQVGDHV